MMKLLGYIRTAGFKANIVIVPERASSQAWRWRRLKWSGKLT